LRRSAHTVRKYYKYGYDREHLHVNITGAVNIANGIASNFSSSNYLRLPNGFNHRDFDTFKYVFKVKVTNSSDGCLLGQSIDAGWYSFFGVSNDKVFARGYSGSDSWLFALNGTTDLPSDEWRYISLEFTGTEYNLSVSTDGVTFNTEAIVTTSSKFSLYNGGTIDKIGYGYDTGSSLRFPFQGYIDVAECYIMANGEMWWRGADVAIIEATEDDYDFYRDEIEYRIEYPYKGIRTEKVVTTLTVNSSNPDLEVEIGPNINKESSTEVLTYKMGRVYYKYEYADVATPVFNSQAEATEGIDGVKIIGGANYYSMTGTSTTVLNNWNTVTFDIGEHNKNIKSLGYVGVCVDSQYPGTVLLDVQCSEDNQTWTTIRSSFGGRGNYKNYPLNIPYPNNYRYLRYTTYCDDPGFGQYGGSYGLSILYSKAYEVRSTSDDYDFYRDELTWTKPQDIAVDVTKNPYKLTITGTPETNDTLACTWVHTVDPDHYSDKALKQVVTKYYKGINETWLQPIFSSNTKYESGIYYTLRGSRESGAAYLALNGSWDGSENCWWTGSYTVTEADPAIWNIITSKPIKIITLKIKNEVSSPVNFKTATWQGSKDNENWDILANINGTNTTGYITTVNFTQEDLDYYPYHRFVVTESFGSGVSVQQFGLTGYTLGKMETTPDQAEYTKTVNVYKLYR